VNWNLNGKSGSSDLTPVPYVKITKLTELAPGCIELEIDCKDTPNLTTVIEPQEIRCEGVIAQDKFSLKLLYPREKFD
jgi:hypothetical protein